MLQAFASTLVEVLAVQVLPLIGLALHFDAGGKRWAPLVSGLFVPVAAFIPMVGVALARRASASCRVGAWPTFLVM
ncbi:MAG: hypothetical protein DI584_06185 [Stenotrophomonas sp.]|nr:MAG: hypothetical protein DI584_06185 [Stenotrophomonas sp.]